MSKINNHQKITAHLFWFTGGMTIGSFIHFQSWLISLSMFGLTIFFYAYSLLGDEFIKIQIKNDYNSYCGGRIEVEQQKELIKLEETINQLKR